MRAVADRTGCPLGATGNGQRKRGLQKRLDPREIHQAVMEHHTLVTEEGPLLHRLRPGAANHNRPLELHP